LNRLRALTGRPRLAAFLLYLGISAVMFGLFDVPASANDFDRRQDSKARPRITGR
jgi:hypothetical protein